jgi:tRNA dimethylallyltransferase
MSQKKILIVLAGPTAVGKTDIAIRLAQYFDTAVISADSRQCYREMSIGTAKPSAEELAAVPHYFIDSFSLEEELNAADYERLALGYAAEVLSSKDIAVVCGGTGLYIKALCEGIDAMPPSDRAVEQALQQQYEQQGIAWLQAQVSAEDPLFYAQAEQQNPARLIRALAFKRSTGQSIVQYRSGQAKERPFAAIKVALDLPRPVLYQRINQRVDSMMQTGLLQEARGLYPLRHLKNLQTVGYTELFDYMDGTTDLDTAVALIKQHSRNYAKRQLTWFRKDADFAWFNPQDYDAMLDYILEQRRRIAGE